MLHIPQAILDAMPKGPLARDARAIRELLGDPERAAILIVTLAEELPAREAVELGSALRGPLGVPLGPLVVNAVPTSALAGPAVDEVLARSAATSGEVGATLRLAASVRAQRRAAELVLAGLARDPGLPIITLPRIPTAEMSPALVTELAPHLSAGLAAIEAKSGTK
jgi:hypothetical protein